MKYTFEVKVSGWMTRRVEADSIEEAREKAADLDWNTPVGELQYKEAIVQDYEVNNYSRNLTNKETLCIQP